MTCILLCAPGNFYKETVALGEEKDIKKKSRGGSDPWSSYEAVVQEEELPLSFRQTGAPEDGQEASKCLSRISPPCQSPASPQL